MSSPQRPRLGSLAAVPFTRRGLIAAAGLALSSSALALAGCGGQTAGAATSTGGSAATGSSAAGSLKTVRIATMGTDNTLLDAAGVAQKLGYLEDELKQAGYKIEYQAFAQAGPAINEAFASGAVDVTAYGDLPGYSAISKGTPIKAFASVNSSQRFGIYVSHASGVREVGDLKGKKVVVGFGTVTHRYLLSKLEEAGIAATDLELVNSVQDGPTMVASGQADAYASALFDVYSRASKSDGEVIGVSEVGDDSTSTQLFFQRTAFAEQNPNVAPAIIRALKRAYDAAREDPDRAIESLVTKTLPKEVVEKVYTGDFSYFDPQITDAVEKKIEELGEFMKANKLVQKTVSTGDYFDLDPYKRAE